MALNIDVNLNPRDQKVQAALRNINRQAKGVDFGGGIRSLDKLSRPLGKITGQASEFEKSLNAANARVIAFGASVVVINKLNEAFSALVQNTVKVEATFAKINIILGANAEQIQKFGTGIFNVAKATGTAFDQVAEGALELARQGLSVEETLSRVETSLKLVRVAGIDSQEAVAGLTAAIKGFAQAGLTVAEIGDKLAEVDTKFAVSTEDLINGLERASASARVAGVSFDELLAVVTTVQERTQRGGAVIGNAFKTIFARVQRKDNLNLLRDLGIAVTDADGNLRAAIPIFQDLAKVINELGIRSEASSLILEKIAGVRQRDILISLVEDLNSGQSQFAKALGVSETAVGSLDRKNQALNRTLEALINNVKVSAQELSAVIGELGFTDAAGDILKGISGFVNSITDALEGETVGSKFARGIVKGVGNVLSGPGLALITAVFIKLFIDLAKFGVVSLKNLLGINKASQEQAILQQSILQVLLSNQAVQAQLLKLEGDKIAQEQVLLSLFNQQAAALQRVQNIAKAVTPTLFGAGLRGGEGGISTKRGASGYIAEGADVKRGVGGAPTNSKVVSIPNFAFGKGQRGTMIANTSEYYVPNYANGGDAIFNRDMVAAMGLPRGAKKINASGGYVPNYAEFNFGTAKGTSFQRASGVVTRGLGARYGGKQIKEGDIKAAEKFLLSNQSATQARAGQRAKSKKQKEAERAQLDASSYSFLVPRKNFESNPGPINSRFKIGKKNIPYTLSNLNIRGPIIPKNVDKAADPRDELLEQNVRDGLINATKRYGDFLSKSIGGKGVSKGALSKMFASGGTRGAFGALQSAVGSAFEVSVARALGIQQAGVDKGGADFDIVNPPAELKMLFGAVASRFKGEFKASDSKGNIDSFAKKIFRDQGRTAASGYVPNFAFGGLEDAIAREQAAGLPINQIRINQDGRLRNGMNPLGLAVTNTRDEPNGSIPTASTGFVPNFQQQEFSFMNDFRNETEKTGKKVGKLGGKFEVGAEKAAGLLIGLTFLQGATEGVGGKFGILIDAATSAAIALSTVALLQDPLKGALGSLGKFGTRLSKSGGALGKLGGGLTSVAGFLGKGGPFLAAGAAAVVGFIALNKAIEKSKDKFQSLDEDIASIDLASLEDDDALRSARQQAISALKTEIDARTQLQKLTGEEDIPKGVDADLLRRRDAFNTIAEFGDPNRRVSGAPFTAGMLQNEAGLFNVALQSARGDITSRAPLGESAEAFARLNEENQNTIARTIQILKAGGMSDSELKELFEASTETKEKFLFFFEGASEFDIGGLLGSLDKKLQEQVEKAKKEAENIAINTIGILTSVTNAVAAIKRDRILNRGIETRAADDAFEQSRREAINLSQTGADFLTRSAQQDKDLADVQIQRNDLQTTLNTNILEQIKGITKSKTLVEDQVESVKELAKSFLETSQTNEDIANTSEAIIDALGLGGVEAEEFRAKFEEIAGNSKTANAELDEIVKGINDAATNADLFAQALAKAKLPGLKEDLNVAKAQLGLLLDDPDNPETRISADKARQQAEEKRRQEEITKLKNSLEIEGLSELEKEKIRVLQNTAELELQIFTSTENAKQKVFQETLTVNSNAATRNLESENSLLGIQKSLRLDILNADEKLNLELRQKTIEAEKETKNIDDQISLKKASLLLDKDNNVIKNQINEQIQNEIEILKVSKQAVADRLESEEGINAELKRRQGLAGGAIINSQRLKDVEDAISRDIPENFASNLTRAFQDASRGAKSLSDSLQDGARAFGQTLLDQFLEIQARKLSQSIFGTGEEGSTGFLGDLLGFSNGGLVSGGSGVQDDVPAKLTDGEFVVRKSAVDKYGLEFLERLNNGFIGQYQEGGNFFDPASARGGQGITGTEDLLRFAMQGSTSGATDQISATASGASVNLETQSRRLTGFARARQSPARQQLDRAREQAFETVLAQRQEDARAAEDYQRQVDARKNAVKGAFMSSLVSSAFSGAASGELFGESFNLFGTDIGSEAGGIGGFLRKNVGDKLNLGERFKNFASELPLVGSMFQKTDSVQTPPTPLGTLSNIQRNEQGEPTFSFANGGSSYSNTNALLTAGEFVMSAPASAALGQDLLTDINNLRFANGGAVGGGSGGSLASTTTNNNSTMGDVNISVNVDGNGNASVDATTNGEQTPKQAREFAEKVKAVVLQTIQEEQRIAGSLFGT